MRLFILHQVLSLIQITLSLLVTGQKVKGMVLDFHSAKQQEHWNMMFICWNQTQFIPSRWELGMDVVLERGVVHWASNQVQKIQKLLLNSIPKNRLEYRSYQQSKTQSDLSSKDSECKCNHLPQPPPPKPPPPCWPPLDPVPPETKLKVLTWPMSEHRGVGAIRT